MEKELLNNLEKIHTTKMGIERIKKNLEIDGDVVKYCINKVVDKNCKISLKQKNWYAQTDDCIITINANSYTIITAHKIGWR